MTWCLKHRDNFTFYLGGLWIQPGTCFWFGEGNTNFNRNVWLNDSEVPWLVQNWDNYNWTTGLFCEAAALLPTQSGVSCSLSIVPLSKSVESKYDSFHLALSLVSPHVLLIIENLCSIIRRAWRHMFAIWMLNTMRQFAIRSSSNSRSCSSLLSVYFKSRAVYGSTRRREIGGPYPGENTSTFLKFSFFAIFKPHWSLCP